MSSFSGTVSQQSNVSVWSSLMAAAKAIGTGSSLWQSAKGCAHSSKKTKAIPHSLINIFSILFYSSVNMPE